MDRARQCAALLGRNGTARRCQAWPLGGLPFCPTHDPEEMELRRRERRAMEARLA
jgi:hypothetical protein